jgi:hypothetical protein
MADRVAMEVLRPFFLQVDPYPICESSWLALHIFDILAVLELLVEPLLPAHSCRIENVSFVDSMGSRSWLLFSFLFKLCF